MNSAIKFVNLERYTGGYKWVDSQTVVSQVSKSPAKSEQVLTTGLPAGSYEQQQYSPPPDLFLTFAGTPLTADGIREFADRFGMLGLTENQGGVKLGFDISPDQPALMRFNNRAIGFGELLSSWRQEIQLMRQATNLWSALNQPEGKTKNLSRYVQWVREDLVYYDSHPQLPHPPITWLLGVLPYVAAMPPGRAARADDDTRTIAVIASNEINSEWFKWFRRGDCEMPARYYLQGLVNEKLKGLVSPKLLWNVRDNRPHDLVLSFVPEGLLSAVWLQFAEAVNGNRMLRQCTACKKWIVISPEGTGSRSNRSTCSNACRMRIYYYRKIQARQALEAGSSIKETAKLLNTTTERVRFWLTTSKASASARTRRK